MGNLGKLRPRAVTARPGNGNNGNGGVADNAGHAETRIPVEPVEPDLESRAVAVLIGDGATPEEISAVVAELEAEATKAEQEAVELRGIVADPIACPDPKGTMRQAEDREIARGRLETLASRLRSKWIEVDSRRRAAKWNARADALEVLRDELAARWREELAPAVDKILALFASERILNERLATLHFDRPSGESRHLKSAELIARNLDHHDREHPPIVDRCVICQWDLSNMVAWPPKPVFDSRLFAPVDLGPAFSKDWGSPEVQAERAALAERENRQIADYHAKQEREQEERLHREGR